MNKNNGKNKKIIIVIIIIIIMMLFTIPKEENNIRIRVLANSNDSIDLKEKEEVVKTIKKYVNADDTKDELIDKLAEIRKDLKSYSKKINKDIEVKITKTKFPVKKLDEKIVPGGTYETLLVTIGEGKGNNYWTILYPEYFGITFEEIYAGEVEIKFYFYELFKK